jgi:glutathione S-transferase
MAMAAGVRLQTGSTVVASPIREVTPATCASSTTASWVHPSALPTGLLDEFPRMAAYVARGEARPAYERAFAAQWAINAGHSQAG